jgi:thioredoxin-related protein
MRFLLLCFVFAFFQTQATASGKNPLPSPPDLSRNEAQAVVILFSLPDCAFCVQLRKHTLMHLESDPRYRGKLQAYEVSFGENSTTEVTWFDSRKYTGTVLAKRLGVVFSPTVLVFDRSGRLAGKPLLGAGLPEFYGAYLDELIQRAWHGP